MLKSLFKIAITEQAKNIINKGKKNSLKLRQKLNQAQRSIDIKVLDGAQKNSSN